MLFKKIAAFTFVWMLTGQATLPAESLTKNAMEGKWVMDKKKSVSGKFAPVDLVQEIKMNGTEIVVESKYVEPKSGVYPLFWVGLMTPRLQLASDGSEVLNQVGPFAHKSKTTVDGNKMVTEWVAVNDPGSVEGQWIRTLSEDGREMTLELKGKASDGRVIDASIVMVRK
jgi:hypothetical protein